MGTIPYFALWQACAYYLASNAKYIEPSSSIHVYKLTSFSVEIHLVKLLNTLIDIDQQIANVFLSKSKWVLKNTWTVIWNLILSLQVDF